MEKVQFRSYGNYSSNNYGVNALVFMSPEGWEFYFSYKTLVAFGWPGQVHCIRNYWGPTTGKHLNWIESDHKKRLTQDEFNKAYLECFGKELAA